MPVGALRRLVTSKLDGTETVLVDIGCGTGALLREIHRLHPQIKLSGIEPDAVGRAQAKSWLPEVAITAPEPDGRFPLANNIADVCVLSLVLHHVEQDAVGFLLTETRRVLKPAGKLIVLDWTRPTRWYQWIPFAATRIFDGWKRTSVAAQGKLTEVITQAGFQKTESSQLLTTWCGTLEAIVFRC
jgi:SAM-dependent methyltransferase